MNLEKIVESFKKNGKIWFRRRGWNEEWVLTSDPVWDIVKFEYKTIEEMEIS